eukprot:Seg308.3 transcript_id=Seg308.3/GoldUCD/mRNA.D3Y31 product="tRNA-splicing endonuclease subunit Sen34" protein_id=Seg308.3/GoldUCD/D3Y31
MAADLAGNEKGNTSAEIPSPLVCQSPFAISVTKINILISVDGSATVWDKDDVLKLKKQLRIPGALIGSLARKPWQNQVMSLPLILTPEEVTLLIEKDYAILIDRTQLSSSPTADEVEYFTKLREQSHGEQIKIFVREREEKKQMYCRRDTNCFEAGKHGQHLKDSSPQSDTLIKKLEDDTVITSEDIQNDTRIKQEINETKQDFNQVTLSALECPTTVGNSHLQAVKVSNMQVEKQKECVRSNMSIPGVITSEKTTDTDRRNETANGAAVKITETDMQYYSKSTWIHIPTSVTDISRNNHDFQNKTSITWNYPRTVTEQFNYAVYKDLWEKGYFITTGEKFGCDFLVYPGDPSRYHSYFTVIVIPSTRKITSMELLAYGRLGSGVKKSVVLATVNGTSNHSVKYQSISWSSID